MDKTKDEFQISGRTFPEQKFFIAEGKAIFSTISIPKITEGQFTMASVWKEGQFNTIDYEEA